jgi:hypothetical protein
MAVQAIQRSRQFDRFSENDLLDVHLGILPLE